MNIAVLGANGFLGKYICHYLKNHVIYPVTRNICDLADYNQVSNWLDQHKVDVVINCATAGGKTRVDAQDYDDLQNNLKVFLNFYNQRHKFSKFINIGSGAEFDRRTSIDSVEECKLFSADPVDSYGLSKNIISRICAGDSKFYTLRLFGVFHRSEPEFRLLQKCLSQDSITIRDIEFDMISAEDFLTVLEYYITNNPTHRDINCVYATKQSLKSIVTKFASIHNSTLDITVEAAGEVKNYTGNGNKLRDLGIKLAGLDIGLELY